MENPPLLLEQTVLLPKQAQAYFLSKGALSAALCFVLGWVVLHLKGLTCSPAPCDPQLGQYLLGFGLFALGGISLLLSHLRYGAMSYEVTQSHITINSGIVVKDAVTVDFHKIQTVDLQQGPILAMFGLCLFRIWTAAAVSPRNSPVPSGQLWLQRDDALALRNYIFARQQ